MSFKKYIKAVGTGPKGNRELNEDEIVDAIKLILNRDVTDAQIGAFLVAWRTKFETIGELKGTVKALKSFMNPKKIEDSMELGYSFDGRVKNPFLFPLYDEILEKFYENNKDIRKLNLVISGDYVQPAKNGLTTKEIFENLDLGRFLFYFNRIEYLNKLSDLTTLRHELGLRTAFNTVEKLLNPGVSEYGVTTAFHKPYVQKYLDIFEDDFKEVIVVKASEGSPEVFKDGKFWKKTNDEIIETSFSLKDYGVLYKKEFDKITLNEALNIVKNPDDEIMQLAKFNIALYLVFANRVTSLSEAWERLN
ncbi:glycosyl transferase [Arcobacter sp. YIC-80]|uniref:glycosyl transferase n=1 Tax=unclassified Arcobacter TaxID=2593671 RepID=UPI00385032BE